MWVRFLQGDLDSCGVVMLRWVLQGGQVGRQLMNRCPVAGETDVEPCRVLWICGRLGSALLRGIAMSKNRKNNMSTDDFGNIVDPVTTPKERARVKADVERKLRELATASRVNTTSKFLTKEYYPGLKVDHVELPTPEYVFRVAFVQRGMLALDKKITAAYMLEQDGRLVLKSASGAPVFMASLHEVLYVERTEPSTKDSTS